MNFINFNGEILASSAILTSNNRAFRYGDGLFESIRMIHQRLPFLEDHYQRLVRGMKLLGYNYSADFNIDILRNLILGLCEKNSILESGRIRLTVYRKEGGLYGPENNDFDFIIEANPLTEPIYQLNSKGLIVGLSKNVKKTTDQTSNIKSTNALLMVMAAREAQSNNWHETLILNHDGHIAEATASNLFIVKGETIYTPPIEDGALGGVMRKQIAFLIKQSKYKLIIKSIHPDDIDSVDEIFLTNAVKGIMWVVGYGNKRYYHRISKELVFLLNKHIE